MLWKAFVILVLHPSYHFTIFWIDNWTAHLKWIMRYINLATRPSCTCSLRFWSGKRENDPDSQKCSILIRARLLERFLLFLSFLADINILNRTYMYNFLGYLKDRPALVDVSSTYMNALDLVQQVHWTMGRVCRFTEVKHRRNSALPDNTTRRCFLFENHRFGKYYSSLNFPRHMLFVVDFCCLIIQVHFIKLLPQEGQ